MVQLQPTCRGGLTLALTCICLALLPSALAQDKGGAAKDAKKKDDSLRVSGQLTRDDPTDKARDGRHHKVHTYHMEGGKRYLLDLMHVNGHWDVYLRLEDSAGKQWAVDDDSGGNNNARIIFSAPKTDTYRLIATSYTVGQIGQYLLTGRPLAPGEQIPSRPPGGTSPGPLILPAVMGDIIVTPVLMPRPSGGLDSETHGYVEYRFTIQNRSPTKGHRVSLTVPRDSGFYYGGAGYYLNSLKRTVEVRPSATMTVSLLQPDLAFRRSANQIPVGVDIDGKAEPPGLSVTMRVDRGFHSSDMKFRYGHHPGRTEPMVNVLGQVDLSQRLEQYVFKSAVDRYTTGIPGFGSTSSGDYKGKRYVYTDTHRFHHSVDVVAAWSEDWLAYSSYDGLVLRGPELESAPPTMQAAIQQYVECGGSLVLLGACKVPQSWERTRTKAAGFTSYHPGFGQCLVSEGEIETWEPPEWHVVTDMWKQSAQPWQQVADPTSAHERFPVVDQLGIPVRTLFMVMLLFSILIGPVNIYVLSRQNRRIWMLWTVPAVSLATCGFLFAYMFLSEGWHGKCRAEALTILDENTQRATTVGNLGLYSPVVPAGGLRFGYETELTPHLGLGKRHYYGSSRQEGRIIDWTDGQRFESGWLSPRVPAYFMQRRSELRTERIGLRQEADGTLAMTNGLNARIRSIWLHTAEGKLFSAEQVKSEAQAVLTPIDKLTGTKTATDQLRRLFSGNWIGLVDSLTANPTDFLQPGTYLAVIEDAPFVDLGLQNADSYRSRSVVYGILKVGP